MARPLRAVPAVLVPAVGSIRVSKAREEMISPDLQRSAITRWAAENGRVIVAWLEDLDASGRNFVKRNVLQGIAMIEAGTAEEILVYRYDRWGRNTADSLANIARTEKAGGHVLSVTEPFDAETAVGKYTRTNALALAEMQSDIIGENWKAAHANRLERQLPHSGMPRFGYTYTPRKQGGDGLYHPHPTTGPLLAGLYPRWLAGETFGVFARELNAAGYRTPRFGTPWEDRYVLATMDSGFAAGLIHAGGLYHPGAQTPLIPAGVWEAYRVKRAATPKAPAHRHVTYRLSGLMTCGHCGSAACFTGRARVACRRHTANRFCLHLGAPRSTVEDTVRTWLGSVLDGTEMDVQRAIAAKAKASRAKADVELLKAEKVEVERLMLKAFDAHMRDIVDEPTYRAHRADLQRRLDDLTTAVTTVQAEPEVPREVITNALQVWDDMPVERMNVLLKALIGTVIVRRDRIFVIPRWELLT